MSQKIFFNRKESWPKRQVQVTGFFKRWLMVPQYTTLFVHKQTTQRDSFLFIIYQLIICLYFSTVVKSNLWDSFYRFFTDCYLWFLNTCGSLHNAVNWFQNWNYQFYDVNINDVRSLRSIRVRIFYGSFLLFLWKRASYF